MRILLGLLLSFFLAAGFAQVKQKVLFQVSDNDPAKWNLALNNARNVQADLGKDKVQIEIVAYGPGLNMLKAESKVAVLPDQRHLWLLLGETLVRLHCLELELAELKRGPR